jgi:hypothetical protein
MRQIAAKAVLLLATVAASPGWGQTIASIKPASAPAGSSDLTITVSGANFVAIPAASLVPTVFFSDTPLVTQFVNTGTLTAVVPASLMTAPFDYQVVVINPNSSASNAVTFSVLAPSVASLSPASIPRDSPAFALSVIGANFVPGSQVSFAGVTVPTTFVTSGTLSAVVPADLVTGAGAGTVSVLVTNPGGSVSAPFTFVVSPPALSISPNSSVPSGVVRISYTGLIIATGGTPPYSFKLNGKLPDGLTLAPGGAIAGTPTTPGRFQFAVIVTDSAGGVAPSGFSITIQAPLNISGGPSGSVPTGTPVSITFTGTGGLPPYLFSTAGSLPQGTTFSGGVLSGTPTTVGTFPLRVTITDSTGAVFSKDFTVTVTLPPLSLSGSLKDGKVGVPYAGQISATGGTGPYSYTGSGLPDGLSLSAPGAITGTPTVAGQFTLAATVTDSQGATAAGTFRITIVPADLSIVTASLPPGAVGLAYTASLVASGGVPPYVWTVTGLPDGLTATAAGAISGTPTKAGPFSVVVNVKDAAGTTFANRQGFILTIAPTPFAITTASAPNGTVGAAYTTSFTAAGGIAPYTFSASGLPAGLSMSAAGVISGTPTAPGATTIVVTVKDSAGASASKSYAVTIGLPPAPPVNVTVAGISDTAGPLLQPRLQIALGGSYPLDVVVTLTLAFTPDSGADDPTIQFSSGGRTARITVPAGATAGAADVGVQTGSVAGLIAITAQLQAGGLDVTPSPAPRRTIRIAALAPVIVPSTLTAVRNTTGFTVTLTGYATDRELTQAVFAFAGAPGSNLQTTTLTVPVNALFAPYFAGTAAAPFGSQFAYTQPFTVTGSTQAIVSVTVTLVNLVGQSVPVTATLN